MSGPLPQFEELPDRADALATFLRAAGNAPLLLTPDDGPGCSLFMALAALHWTGETGLVRPDDRLHAVWFAAETSAAVIERTGGAEPAFRFLGPRMEAPQKVSLEGVVVVDEPFVRGYEFRERWSALAHFLVVTQGRGALLALFAQRAPKVGHIQRWLLELFRGPIPKGADALQAAWFSVTGAGFLFPPAAFASDASRGWTYLELGARHED